MTGKTIRSMRWIPRARGGRYVSSIFRRCVIDPNGRQNSVAGRVLIFASPVATEANGKAIQTVQKLPQNKATKADSGTRVLPFRKSTTPLVA